MQPQKEKEKIDHEFFYKKNHSEECQNNDLVYINMLDRVITHKWHTKVTVIVHKEGADLNYINEGLIPSKYFVKTTEILNDANNNKLVVNNKLQDTAIYNQGICFEMPFIMVKNLSHELILGNPFLHMLYPITSITEEGITNRIKSHDIIFKFVTKPRYHEIDVLKHQVKRKENFFNFLNSGSTI